MALAPGTRLGPYVIETSIGAGGMGEVYRARDTKLDRAVAIKILPGVFAADADRVARFEREAKTLAALNHPHIAQIYGVADDGGMRALVMEFVDGATLTDVIARGRVPIDEALPIARQIAEALQAAHEHGIIHRDLKPANIKVRADGTVKVLDFGLAKAVEPLVQSSSVPTEPPTITSPAITHAGIILGTAAYMAPEQARGKAVDQRADLWAFGCVLFEMLTACPPFAGATVTDVLARVLEREPDWRMLPAETPLALRRLLRRALQKDPRKRWHHIGDVALDLEASIDEGANLEPTSSGYRHRWHVAAGWLAAVMVAAVSGIGFWRTGPTAPVAVTAFEIAAPSGQLFGVAQAAPFAALSPDGRRIVFQSDPLGSSQSLWIRAFDDTTARRLPGTENGQLPFWSPDSRAVAFSRARRLYRLDIGFGSPQVICDLPAGAAEGGAWGENGSILIGSPLGGIYRVPAAGGVPQAITSPTAVEKTHHWPVWLPGERQFLYRAGTGAVFRASTDGGPAVKVVDASSRVEYVSPGLLLFVRGASLLAQPFDAEHGQLTGEPSVVTESVRLGFTGRATFSAHSDVLVYRSGAGNEIDFTWDLHDGEGKVRQSLPLKRLRNFALSPDGTQIAVHTHEQGTANGELWLVQLESGGVTRAGSEKSHDDFPVWSPDGTRLAVADFDGLAIIRADGGDTRERLVANETARPTDWVARRDWIIYHSNAPDTDSDIWGVPLTGDRRPRVLVQTRFEERNGVVSPDGEWLAYTSTEGGRPQVYVGRFPALTGKSVISLAGGSHPRWGPNGTTLYYWSVDERVMRVPLRVVGGGLRPGKAEAVLPLKNTAPQFGTNIDRSPYILGPKGMGFIGVQGAGSAAETSLKVVLHWREDLKRRAAR